MRVMKEFVAELKNKLGSLLDVRQKFTMPQDNLVYLSAQFNIDSMIKLLRKHRQNNAVANKETLSEFINYLHCIWQSNLNTDKIYHIHYKSHANQMAVMLQEMITAETGLNKFKLLMPTLQNDDFDPNIKLHQYVMSDDNRTMIDVVKCLEYLEENRKNDKRLYHTHPVGDSFLQLSKAETDRVIKHSREANEYYHAMIKNESSKVIRKCNANLKHALANIEITYTYDMAGLEKLHNELYSSINDRKGLIKQLLRLPASDWCMYLNNINNEKLKPLTLDGHADFTQAVLSPNNYSLTNEKEDRVSLLLFAYFYEKQRESLPTYTGFISVLGYAKDKKINAVKLMKEFLTSKMPLAEFPAFMQIDKNKMYLKAMKSDTLGYLHDKIIACSKVDYKTAHKQAEVHRMMRVG